MSVERSLIRYQDRIEGVLDRWLPAADRDPGRLHQAMRYAVIGGGKRVRPLLVYLTGEALAVERAYRNAGVEPDTIHLIEAPTPGSGSVAGASLEDVLQLRYTLEPFIVGLVAQSISSKEVGQLRLTLMDMREALEAGDSEAGVNAYIAFHEELFTLTSNPIFQNPKRGIGSLE